MANSVTVEELIENQDVEDCEPDEIYTQDGSKDWNGRTAIKGKSGGWGVGILLLVNQGLATLAFYGVGLNMVIFLTRVLQLGNAEAANQVSNWTGTAYIFSLVGAFISDSYWGRFKTCAIFQLIFVGGLVELSLSTWFLLFKPCVPGDEEPNCKPPKGLGLVVFYLSIYQIALGSGGYQPTVATFGADQFDEDDAEEGGSKVAFFSYFYMANNIGTLFSNTELAYLENKGKWLLGFWISTGAAILALALFLTGTSKYRYFKPGGNPLVRIAQVIVASLKKWKADVPRREEELYEEADGQNSAAAGGGRRILHTPDFRFLDRAAVVTSRDNLSSGTKAWKLCTVTQVEELKCILRLLPIWLCTIIYSAVYSQMGSVFIVQGAAMETSLSPAFSVPPACMSVFEIFGVSGMVLLYRLYIVPLLSKTRINPTELQRMGIGLVVSAMAMASAGVVELERLKYAKGNKYDQSLGSSSLSIVWQIPQYLLIGASEVFMYVGQLEFFNGQMPDGMKSFGSALYVASMAAGSYLSSFIVTIVMDISGRGDRIGWISQNLNRGHLDDFYFLLAGLTIIDLVVFVVCAKRYRYISFDRKMVGGEEEEEEEGDVEFTSRDEMQNGMR